MLSAKYFPEFRDTFTSAKVVLNILEMRVFEAVDSLADTLLPHRPGPASSAPWTPT